MTMTLQQIIRDVVKQVPDVLPYLSDTTRAYLAQPKATKALTDYSSIRDRFWDAVYNAVEGFLTSNQQPGTASRTMATALSQAYIEGGDVAYQDGGGDLPLDPDTAAWARGEIDAQFGFVDSMFQTLKSLRKEGEFDAGDEAQARAVSWTYALDGFYNAVKMRAAGNKMLTWNLGNTEKHCHVGTYNCASLAGQRHRASWFVARGLTPRKPGSNTTCGGYNCDCYYTDDNGNEFTI